MTDIIESDKFELLITLIEEQRDRIELSMRRILQKRVVLLSFEMKDFERDDIERFIRDQHRRISFSGQRKNITRKAMLIQGDLIGFNLQIDGIELRIVPWNNTALRFEQTQSFEFRLSMACDELWTFSNNMVPCILFEDYVNQKWYVLRVDAMPWDGLL